MSIKITNTITLSANKFLLEDVETFVSEARTHGAKADTLVSIHYSAGDRPGDRDLYTITALIG